MELLLILVLGGLCAWLMRPLRDWYVVEVQDGLGMSPRKSAFTTLDAAQQAFDGQVLQDRAHAEEGHGIHLWHVEARSRAEALKAGEAGQPMAVLLKSAGS